MGATKRAAFNPLARTRREASEHYEAVERMRRAVERKHYEPIAKALQAQTRRMAADYRAGRALGSEEDPSGLAKALAPLYREAFITFARRTHDEILKRAGKDADEVLLWEQLAARFIADIGTRKIKEITEATRQFVSTVIQRGVAEGLSIPNIARNIVEDLGEINETTRATRIARTEVTGAANYGAVEGARSTGLGLEKQWLAAPDTRTRHAHRVAGGLEGPPQLSVPLDAAFIVDGEALEYPGDPAGSPGNVINCRCATTFSPVS